MPAENQLSCEMMVIITTTEYWEVTATDRLKRSLGFRLIISYSGISTSYPASRICIVFNTGKGWHQPTRFLP